MDAGRHARIWGYRLLEENSHSNERDREIIRELVTRSERYNNRVRNGPLSCDCDPANPCTDNDCVNRADNYECRPEDCMAGCQNQELQNLVDAPVTVRVDPRGLGFGLFATRNIAEGEVIGEYIGQYSTLPAGRVEIDSYYAYSIDEIVAPPGPNARTVIIDSYKEGNEFRFLNHSCLPNCEKFEHRVGNEVRIGIRAIANIAARDAVVINYGREYFTNLKCVCALCEAGGGVEAEKRRRRGGRRRR